MTTTFFGQCRVFLTLLFLLHGVTGQHFGSRCRQTSDCRQQLSTSNLVCRWMARECGFGVCSCPDRLVEYPVGSGRCASLNVVALQLIRSTPKIAITTISSATGPRWPQTVHNVNYGEACDQNRQCEASLTCLAGKCGCPSSTRFIDGNCRQNEPGDSCQRDEECFMALNTICSKMSKKCACRPGFREMTVNFNDLDLGSHSQVRCLSPNDTLLTGEGDFCGDAYPTGIHLNKHLCGNGLQCTTCEGHYRICTRDDDLAFVSDTFPMMMSSIEPYQIVCSTNQDCPSEETMLCQRPLDECRSRDGKCVCLPGYQETEGGVCKKAVTLGQPCRNHKVDNCVDKNSECVNGQCQCGDSWQIGPGNKCVSNRARLFYGYACSVNGTWDCHGNMICNLIDGSTRCSCPTGQRIDDLAVHFVEFQQIDGSPGYYAEKFRCIDIEIGDGCLQDSDCVKVPNSRCESFKCVCNSGYIERPMLMEDNALKIACVKEDAGRGVENGTCGSKREGVSKICGDSHICRHCGGNLDRMICGLVSNTSNVDNEAKASLLTTAFELHKIGDICMNDEDCDSKNGDLVCGLVAPVCGIYGKCVCAPGYEESYDGKCRPRIGQRCSSECASSRTKCQFGICQCDATILFSPQWHSLGGKLHCGPIGSAIDCTVWETQFYGDACSDTSQCFRGLTCSNGTCLCPVGYKLKLPTTRPSFKYSCTPVEVGDLCSNDDDCHIIPNAKCNRTASTCDCRSGYKPVQYYYYPSGSNKRAIKKRCVPDSEQPSEAKQRCSYNDGPFCKPDHVCANCLFGNSARDSFCLPQI